MSLGCYAKYIGHYVIPREGTVDYSQAEERIYEAIRDLGFKRHKEYFLKSSEAVPLYARQFEGDDASVRVDVWEDPLDITLDDTSNRHETEFMREPFDFEHPMLTQMGNQVSFAADADGSVYLAYLYQNRIEKYSAEGKLLWRADRKQDYSTDPPKDKGKREARGGGVMIQMPRMNQCAEGIAVDGSGRVWVVTLNRQTREEEQVGVNMTVSMSGGERKMSMKPSGNTELRTTDVYRLEIYSPEGELLGSLPLDHFVDGMTIKGDRLFLWDAVRGAKFYEYRIKEQ